jgi:hypothetical protein
VDVPRTAPDVPFFQQEAMQSALRRLLYIWGVRHPASGYVQGVNDLVTPFLAVFLSEHFPSADMSTWQSAALSEEQLLNAEADSYWCLCKLVERYVQTSVCGVSSFLVLLVSSCTTNSMGCVLHDILCENAKQCISWAVFLPQS